MHKYVIKLAFNGRPLGAHPGPIKVLCTEYIRNCHYCHQQCNCFKCDWDCKDCCHFKMATTIIPFATKQWMSCVDIFPNIALNKKLNYKQKYTFNSFSLGLNFSCVKSFLQRDKRHMNFSKPIELINSAFNLVSVVEKYYTASR